MITTNYVVFQGTSMPPDEERDLASGDRPASGPCPPAPSREGAGNAAGGAASTGRLGPCFGLAAAALPLDP